MAYGHLMATLPKMLKHDRKQAGWLVERGGTGVSVREYRELEAGTRPPTFETWDRICNLRLGRRGSPRASAPS